VAALLLHWRETKFEERRFEERRFEERRQVPGFSLKDWQTSPKAKAPTPLKTERVPRRTSTEAAMFFPTEKKILNSVTNSGKTVSHEKYQEMFFRATAYKWLSIGLRRQVENLKKKKYFLKMKQ